MPTLYYETELSHHGIKGMRWGVRRYQNYDGTLTTAGRKRQAKLYQKDLNDIDDVTVDHISKYMRADARFRRYAAKGVKLANTDTPRNAQKLAKVTSKMKEAGDTRKRELEQVKRLESETWKIIGKAAKEGYTVDSKQVTKQRESGKMMVDHLLLGGIPTLVKNLAEYYRDYHGQYSYVNDKGRTVDQAPWAVQGNKYKVRS